MATVGIFLFKENSHGRTGNRTRDLMLSSQRDCPLDHETGPMVYSRSVKKEQAIWNEFLLPHFFS